ncbi:PTS sugar transporter subunit IIA [Streptomyces sp. ISL-66]|nr:PTS sugar transporter subunit IIA [Streptomyces sp. ISL-66]
MSEMITPELVDLGLSADSKEEAARALAERMVTLGRVTDLDGFLADVAAREAQMPTGLEGGIGIPHCRSAHVSAPTLAFGRSAAGVDFGAPDGPADLIFLIAAPSGADDAHLSILSSLARRLMRPDFVEALRSATTPAEAAALVAGEPTTGANAAAPAFEAKESGAKESEAKESRGEAPDGPGRSPVPDRGEAGESPTGRHPFRIVAVTSCPTGIAHTYMAAESLQRAAAEAGIDIQIETQGSAGFTKLTPEAIAAADAVIFAHDVPVRDRARFAGKPTVDAGVKAGINRPAELLREARDKADRGEAGDYAPLLTRFGENVSGRRGPDQPANR